MHRNAKKMFTPFTQSPSGEAQPYLPHAGSQGVFMPSFMPIGLKLWALEGYTHTNRQTDRQSYFNYIDKFQVYNRNYKVYGTKYIFT